jgi:UPF0755 protein
MQPQNLQAPFWRNKHRLLAVLVILVCITAALLTLVAGALNINKPPSTFPKNTNIMIQEGATIKEAAQTLSRADVVRSELYLQFILRTRFASGYIRPGIYHFPNKLTTIEIANAITKGTYSSPPDSSVVTFPEGFRIKDMLSYLPPKYASATLDTFIQYEGYLFPDTYYIQKKDSLDNIVTVMKNTFNEKTAPLQSEIHNSPYSLNDIVTLASILEREGNDERSMRIISGILQKRLKNNMPLQVDATLEYLLGKSSDELTASDLDTDSPYNTYKHTGLPPTPIANPGLVAIKAVLDPINTDYYYYLSDSDGNFHYAKTFEEHKANKVTYLK